MQVRCVYRVIEFAQGYDGALRTTEVYFYCLDSLPLCLSIAIWVVVWPPSFLVDPGSSRHQSENALRLDSLAQSPASDSLKTLTASQDYNSSEAGQFKRMIQGSSM